MLTTSIVYNLYRRDKCSKCIRNSNCTSNAFEMILCSHNFFYKGKGDEELCKSDPTEDVEIVRY